MEEALEWCQLASPTKCTVVVCGGDGTVGWLLSTADKLSLKTNPHVAIFPLGTGKCSLSLEDIILLTIGKAHVGIKLSTI